MPLSANVLTGSSSAWISSMHKSGRIDDVQRGRGDERWQLIGRVEMKRLAQSSVHNGPTHGAIDAA